MTQQILLCARVCVGEKKVVKNLVCVCVRERERERERGGERERERLKVRRKV